MSSFLSLVILWLLTSSSAFAGSFVRPTASSTAINALSSQLLALKADISRIDKALDDKSGSQTNISGEILVNEKAIERIHKLVDDQRRQDQNEDSVVRKELNSLNTLLSQLQRSIEHTKEKNKALFGMSPPCRNHPVMTSQMSYFYIENTWSGLVLGVQNHDRSAGSLVVMSTKVGSNSQLWTYNNNVLYSKLNGMVLTLDGYVKIFPCHGGSNQFWFFDGVNIRNGNGYYMDVLHESTQPGAKLLTYGLKGWWSWTRTNQQFQVVPVCSGC